MSYRTQLHSQLSTRFALRRDNSTRRRLSSSSTTTSTLPQSITNRVTRSWNLVADKTEQVGIDFFLRLFAENPQAADLFKFGDSSVLDDIQRDPNTGKLLDSTKDKVPKELRLHAEIVMDTVGVCVGGLSRFTDLVPTLRSLGKTHSSLGVQPFHYDALYKHLLDAIESEIGKGNFDNDTRESWEIVYRSLTQVMKNPYDAWQVEPLEGWGIIVTVACTVLTILTPLQMAKLTVGNAGLEYKFNIVTILSSIILSIDFCSHWIAECVRPRAVASADKSKQSSTRRYFDRLIFPLKFRLVRFLRSLQMDRWVPFQKMEATVLLSYPLQYIPYIILTMLGNNSYNLDSVGVHWTYSFGLLRLAASSRVYHSATCAERNYLLKQQKIKNKELSTIQMIKLIGITLVMIHVTSTLWCLVARIEYGPGNDPISTAFFPLAERMFTGNNSLVNRYLHATHWAWVNLAGIGNNDSMPETTLECIVTLLVHICGATLYTIIIGNFVNILETMSRKRNEVSTDLVELSQFLQNCNTPQHVQKRVMEGYMMKNMMGNTDGNDQDGGDEDILMTPESVSRLPSQLEIEVSLYYRAEAIRRCDPAFSHCSNKFMIAFVGSLVNPIVLLAEERYELDGARSEQVILLVEGTMKMIVSGVCTRHLEPGDLIGKTHLFLKNTNERRKKKACLCSNSNAKLVTGLSTRKSVEYLHQQYPKDLTLLIAESEPMNIPLPTPAVSAVAP